MTVRYSLEIIIKFAFLAIDLDCCGTFYNQCTRMSLIVLVFLGLFSIPGMCYGATADAVTQPTTTPGDCGCTFAYPGIDESSSTVGEKSKAKCAEYAENVYQSVYNPYLNKTEKYDTCKLVEPVLTGEKDPEPKEFPHQVGLGTGARELISWQCAGSLISKKFVLSAAQCTGFGVLKIRWARIGVTILRPTEYEKNNQPQSVIHEIEETINHPNYRTGILYNDIALYRLKEAIVFNEFIRPICLHTEYSIPKKYAIATGWGASGYILERGNFYLLKINLTIHSTEMCTREWVNAIHDLPYGFNDSQMLCAGYSNNEICANHSGWPLQYRLESPRCMYALIGVVSFGHECGRRPPAGFTRVSSYIPWIENIVWP